MVTQLQYARFGISCRGCGATLIVQPANRESGICCTECGIRNGPWPSVPIVGSLPDNNTDLKTVIRFSDSYNPIPHLRESLGDDYDTYFNGLRDASIKAFRSGQQAPGTLDELLTCLAYAIAVMPYLGISEDNATRLCRWFLDGIRRACSP